MADNTTQTGAAVIAADDVATLNGSASSGVLVQRVKPVYGDDGAGRDVSLSFPLPVTQSVGTSYTLAAFTTSGTAATNTVPMAADVTRKAVVIWNRGTSDLLVGFGVATTATLYSVKLPAGTGYEVPPQFAPSAINVQSAAASVPFNLSAVY